ncbi:hypothetical protein GMD78_13700 [Ornithinibacillus sp. L9]|uniref:YhfM-like domain-containing protein n=1 Tax=Ornithinibacillus caprae TaxID=2678566 RepID=A0A6N8FN05_9BACI|nr:hypothetical protein [Ornithinibacillus caprae]MUK89417.1 hypothetical protein [Ornithinibacillus caprae]
MKQKYFLLIGLLLIVLAGCQGQGATMVLLDEEISFISISESNGYGDINEDILYQFNQQDQVLFFKHVITTASQQDSNVELSHPDFDIMVNYGEDFPVHAIHLWLGEEDESSTLMYMVDDDKTTYITTPKDTNELRNLFQK